MKIRIYCLALLMCAPLISQAQVNKCKQPDGSLTFQDAPCPSGTVSSTVSILPVMTSSDGALGESNEGERGRQSRRKESSIPESKRLQDHVSDYQKRRAEQEESASRAEAEAYNRNVRCNNARQQLGVAKEPRPIFRYDDNGNRQYIEDENRPAAVAAAEQRVAKECN